MLARRVIAPGGSTLVSLGLGKTAFQPYLNIQQGVFGAEAALVLYLTRLDQLLHQRPVGVWFIFVKRFFLVRPALTLRLPPLFVDLMYGVRNGAKSQGCGVIVDKKM